MLFIPQVILRTTVEKADRKTSKAARSPRVNGQMSARSLCWGIKSELKGNEERAKPGTEREREIEALPEPQTSIDVQ